MSSRVAGYHTSQTKDMNETQLKYEWNDIQIWGKHGIEKVTLYHWFIQLFILCEKILKSILIN